ncbi:MAG: prohibitin family protein [Bacteroidaceae bacterium]|nr:prohibitin family protein [Bacteroidaceae bacterium]
MKSKKIVAQLIALVIIVIFCLSFYTIPSGKMGVLATFSKVSETPVKPGLHIKVPVMQTVSKVSTQTQKITVSEECYTKDVQTATLYCEINYNVIPMATAKLFTEVGRNYEDKVIMPIIRGVIKNVIGTYDATNIVNNRENIRMVIEQDIRKELNDKYFENIFIQLSNIDYADKFEQSILEKQVAEQEALRAKNVTVKIQEEANQKIIAAKAEAEALQLKASALEKNQKLVELEAIQKWDGKLPTYMLGDAVPFIDLK